MNNLYRKRYQWHIISLFCLSMLSGYRLQANTSPCRGVFWLEDFTLPSGTTSDSRPTAWTSSTSGSGTYSVQNNQFETSFNGQTEGVWTSGVIDITGRSSTVLSLYLKSVAAGSETFETADYAHVYYKLNGGAETQVYNDVAGIGNTISGTKD